MNNTSTLDKRELFTKILNEMDSALVENPSGDPFAIADQVLMDYSITVAK